MAYMRAPAGGASVIDGDSYFSGTFRSPRDLRIEGEYEGELHCEGTLTIADSARVSATIHAGNVSVSGALQGRVDCAGRFEILEAGQVSAHVVAGSIVVREGAFYEGEMRMQNAPEDLPERELPALTPVRLARVESEDDAPAEVATPGVNGREDADVAAVQAATEDAGI